MNYTRILLENGLKEVHQQKLELIGLTQDEAPSEIRKINIIEMQIEQALKFNKRSELLQVDITKMKSLKKQGYSYEEIAIIFNVAKSHISKCIN
jgi:hypothetical protein